MSIQSELIGYIESQSTITDIVSDRIYYGYRENTILPCLYINFIGTAYSHDLIGSNGIASPRVQFDAYSYSSVQAIQLIQAVRNVLQGYRGLLVNDELISSLLISEDDSFEKPIDGSSKYIHRQIADYELKIRVSIPSF